MRNQNGFTLIELVVVIVVLGILAAVAVPKFSNMEEAAGKAAATGMASAMTSAAIINYAADKADDTKGTQVTSCDAVVDLMDDNLNSLDKNSVADSTKDFQVGADTFAGGEAEGDTVVCTVTHLGTGQTANFTAITVDP